MRPNSEYTQNIKNSIEDSQRRKKAEEAFRIKKVFPKIAR